MNLLILAAAAVSALVVGAIWYHPKVFGTAWMRASGVTEEKIKGSNMAGIFILTLLFAFFISFILQSLVIHQSGAMSIIEMDLENAKPSYQAFMDDYGTAFRTFKHGMLHGFFAGLFFALPVIGTIALYERKGWNYIFINGGYWIVTLTIMGGIICEWT